jgi:hypothetical protein
MRTTLLETLARSPEWREDYYTDFAFQSGQLPEDLWMRNLISEPGRGSGACYGEGEILYAPDDAAI